MNRRWFALVLLLVLLTGCARDENKTEPSEALYETKPTEPVGFYAPDSPAEKETGGAVKAFPLGSDDAAGIRLMGEDVLLFSGHEVTTLTLLSGQDRHIRSQRQLSCHVSPDDPAVIVGTQGVTYVDNQSRALVFLNDRLEEVRRIPLPADCGTPVLSSDRQLLYYCTADALRVLDLRTGLDRLLKEMHFPVQDLVALHCGDRILHCAAVYDDGIHRSLFFAADTGALVHEGSSDIPLWTQDDFYVALHMDGTYPEWLTGSSSSDPQVLVLENTSARLEPVPELYSMLTCRAGDSGAAILELYQLESGTMAAQIMLSDTAEPKSPIAEPETEVLWFLATDTVNSKDVLYSWSLEDSAVTEDVSYLQPRWSRENPDLEGLAKCSSLARRISIKHNVTVLVWADAIAIQPWDYELVLEYQVPLLQRRLEELDDILSCYPEGFLEEAASRTGNGRLSICLVRSISGKPGTGALDSAVGLQFWDQEAKAYLAITTGQDMAQHLHHELFHIIDSRILSSCDAYDNWNKLNPKDFSYDTQYATSRSDLGRSYLSGENRYFIDLYSMSYPKEDRARIMEYAMIDGQADLFQSAPMQKKLRTLCLGIREAFGLDEQAVSYRWEQYLDSPLGPTS